MPFANPNVSDIIATTIEKRSKKIANNVLNHNAVLAKLGASGKVKPFDGGHKILEELSHAENGNAGWYSGYDLLPVAPQDVVSAAEYDIKQAACPVIVSGLERLQNAGVSKFIDLVESRIEVAEDTMKNLVTAGLYSDGTGSGGKQLTGLAAALPAANTTGTYGGINRATWAIWQHKVATGADTAALIQGVMNGLYAQLVRGKDGPDLIILGTTLWSRYLASLQALQRFTEPSKAALGFPTLKFMADIDVVFDNVAGLAATVGYFLNTKYLRFRPHSERNFVPLDPKKRYSINQDAEVQILAFAGNVTSAGQRFQGRISGT
jgi:hypothetical protein